MYVALGVGAAVVVFCGIGVYLGVRRCFRALSLVRGELEANTWLTKLEATGVVTTSTFTPATDPTFKNSRTEKTAEFLAKILPPASPAGKRDGTASERQDEAMNWFFDTLNNHAVGLTALFNAAALIEVERFPSGKPQPRGVLATLRKLLRPIELLLKLPFAGWIAWRHFGGDPVKVRLGLYRVFPIFCFGFRAARAVPIFSIEDEGADELGEFRITIRQKTVSLPASWLLHADGETAEGIRRLVRLAVTADELDELDGQMFFGEFEIAFSRDPGQLERWKRLESALA